MSNKQIHFFSIDRIIKELNGRVGNSSGSFTSTTTGASSIKSGKEINLVSVNLYNSYDSKQVVKKVTGTYFIYDGKKYGTRYRITNHESKVNKFPAANNVVGYINEKDIK